MAGLDQRVDGLTRAELPTKTIEAYALMASRPRANCPPVSVFDTMRTPRRGNDRLDLLGPNRPPRSATRPVFSETIVTGPTGKSNLLFSDDRREHTMSGTTPPSPLLPGSSGCSD
jgi:hypothetical protein